MKIGILGAGAIARKVAQTLVRVRPDMLYAIAARDLERAQAFADEFGMTVAYGSYLSLVSDPEVDVIYVATPHSHHFEHAQLALLHNKPVICEKAFTANHHEAEQLIHLAHERHLFLMEAMWTRFMPLSHQITQILESGVIGRPRLMNSSLCYNMVKKNRIIRPELCGGVLLDLGVYCLNFTRMYFGVDIKHIHSHAILNPQGVDWLHAISIVYKDGRLANMQSAANCFNDHQGVISCDRGYLIVDNINCPTCVRVFDTNYQLIEEHHAPDSQVSGYEYEFLAAEEALRNGWIEHPLMPHQETLDIMQMMDNLRAEWGVCYPNDQDGLMYELKFFCKSLKYRVVRVCKKVCGLFISENQ